MKILLIIPAFNESANIKELLHNISQLKVKVDVIVVNDCSTDDTSKAAASAGARVINLPINLGIGGAVQTGYIFALQNNYDIAIQVDGDGQHDPRYIPELIVPIKNNEADMVIGSRFIKFTGFQSTFSRRIGIKFLQKLIYIVSGEKISDPTSGFRACNKAIIGLFARYYPVDYPEPESLVTLKRHKMRIKEVPVVMMERMGGETSIRSFKIIYYMIKVSLAIIFDKIKKKQGAPC